MGLAHKKKGRTWPQSRRAATEECPAQGSVLQSCKRGGGKAASQGRLTPTCSSGDRGRSLERPPILYPTLGRVSEGVRPVLGSRGKEREGWLKTSTYAGYPSPGKESAAARSRPAGKGSGSGPGRWEAADEPRRGANPATALNCTHLKWPPTTQERAETSPSS